MSTGHSQAMECVFCGRKLAMGNKCANSVHHTQFVDAVASTQGNGITAAVRSLMYVGADRRRQFFGAWKLGKLAEVL